MNYYVPFLNVIFIASLFIDQMLIANSVENKAAKDSATKLTKEIHPKILTIRSAADEILRDVKNRKAEQENLKNRIQTTQKNLDATIQAAIEIEKEAKTTIENAQKLSAAATKAQTITAEKIAADSIRTEIEGTIKSINSGLNDANKTLNEAKQSATDLR